MARTNDTKKVIWRINDALEVVRRQALKRQLLLNHAFDFNADGTISLWVRVINNDHDEVLSVYITDMMNNLDKVTDTISKATALAEFYTKEKLPDIEF